MLQLEEKLCGECGGCVAVCPVGALELLSYGLKVKRDLCNLCENCVIFCPVGALRLETINSEISSFSQKRT
jgi:ferredoxin